MHILGFGAVGTLVSYHLRRALEPKHVITVLHKTPVLAHRALVAGDSVKLERDGVVLNVSGLRHESVDPYEDVLYGKAEAQRLRQQTGGIPTRAAWAAEELAKSPQRHSSDQSNIDTLIVMTKAHAAMQGVQSLLPRLSPNSTIVLLHNGMGVYEQLVRKVFRNQDQRPHIVVCVNTHGAWLKEHGHVVHAGVGEIQLGIMPDAHGRDFEARLDTSLPREEQKLHLNDITPGEGDPHAERYLSLRNTISALTSLTPLRVSWRPRHQVQIAMRQKLVVNAVVNPLTALLGCKNGELLKHPAGRRMCSRLCNEASFIFRAQWYAELYTAAKARKYKGDPYSEDDAHQLFPRELSPGGLMQECERVLNLTRDNVSSMLVDVRRGKDTEVRYMNGYLVGLARKYRVSVPVMASVLDLMFLRSEISLDTFIPTFNVL